MTEIFPAKTTCLQTRARTGLGVHGTMRVPGALGTVLGSRARDVLARTLAALQGAQAAQSAIVGELRDLACCTEAWFADQGLPGGRFLNILYFYGGQAPLRDGV